MIGNPHGPGGTLRFSHRIWTARKTESTMTNTAKRIPRHSRWWYTLPATALTIHCSPETFMLVLNATRSSLQKHASDFTPRQRGIRSEKKNECADNRRMNGALTYNFTVLAVFYTGSSAGPPRSKVGFGLRTMGSVFCGRGGVAWRGTESLFLRPCITYFSGVFS